MKKLYLREEYTLIIFGMFVMFSIIGFCAFMAIVSADIAADKVREQHNFQLKMEKCDAKR